VIVTIWCQMRGWPKDRQRTIFQPVILVTLLMSIVSLGVAGAITLPTVKIFMLGLPALFAGAWSGFMGMSMKPLSARRSCCSCWCPG
jgi:hypothetical protein